MDSQNIKEVYFNEYCNKCEYEKESEDHIACRECLSVPARENSHKPEKFIPKKTS